MVSDRFDAVLPTDARGCIDPPVAAPLDWQPVAVPAGSTLWFHSRTPHRSGANRSCAATPGALPHLQRRVAKGDRRAEYYAAKQAAFAPSRRPATGRWCR